MILRTTLLLLCALLALTGAAPAKDRMEPKPKDLEAIDVVEHRDAQVPTDLSFMDELGRRVTLGDYMNQGKPIILTLNYFNCPMLCTLTLNGMVDALREVPLRAGTDYEILTVSFNPHENSMLAKQKQQNYLQYWGEGGSSTGWHWHVGKKDQIDALCEAIGFKYNYIESKDEYAHPAVLVVLTPDGRISRYIYGVKYDPQTVKLTLVEASKGKIGSPLDRILLYCYHYDSATGAYAPVAMNIMRLAGGVTVILLAIVLSMFWRAEKRRQPLSGTDAPVRGTAGDGARPTDIGVANL